MHSFENGPIVFARRLIARQANASGAMQSALVPLGRTRTAFNRRACFPRSSSTPRPTLRKMHSTGQINTHAAQMRSTFARQTAPGTASATRAGPIVQRPPAHPHRAASGIVNATHAARTTHAGPIVQRPPAHPHHAASGTASATRAARTTRAGQVAQRLPVAPNRPSGPCSSSRQFPRRKAAFPRTRCPSPARTPCASSAPPRPFARCPPQRTGG